MREDSSEDVVSHALVLTLPVSKVPAVRVAIEALGDVRIIATRTGSQRSLWIVRRDSPPPAGGEGDRP